MYWIFINMKNMEIQSTSSPTPQFIISNAVYLTEEAALLCRVKKSTIQKKIRLGLIRGQGRPYRMLGSELLKLVS